MENEVKIAVFNNKNEFVGYKVDTFWTLDNKYPKEHPSKDGEILPHLIRNLEHMCNEKISGSAKIFSDTKIATLPLEQEPILDKALKVYKMVRENNKYKLIEADNKIN